MFIRSGLKGNIRSFTGSLLSDIYIYIDIHSVYIYIHRHTQCIYIYIYTVYIYIYIYKGIFWDIDYCSQCFAAVHIA